MDIQARISINGFYCADCGKFTYQGFDSRDKLNLPNNNAVCLRCGEKYSNIKKEATK